MDKIFYTDASVLHQHGCAGYACVPISDDGAVDIDHALSGSKPSSDIQEMELLAVVTAIRSVPRTQPLTIYTDHKTICDVLARPIRANCERGRNRNIWNQLRQLCATRPVKLHWVRGHDGNPGNEAADRLARFAARQFFATMGAC